MSSGFERTDAYRIRGLMVFLLSKMRSKSTMWGLLILFRQLVIVCLYKNHFLNQITQTMVNLKNCLTAGVLLYGAVFALYGNHWIDPHGVSVYGQEADFSHYPITRGGSVGFSATEGW